MERRPIEPGAIYSWFMRAAWLGLLAWTVAAQDPVGLQEHRARRAALQKALPDGVVVMFGRDGAESAAGGARQEPNFFYLTGRAEPGAVLLLTPTSETLFLSAQDERSRIYDGPRLTAEDPKAAETTGFEKVLPRTALEAELSRALERHARLYTLTSQPQAEKLRALAPLREVADVRTPVARLRVKKSEYELGLIRRSIAVSVEAHLAAWKRLRPGMFEYQLAATMVGWFLESGCEGAAYTPIVGSGPNAVILHYEKNARRIEPGELVLMDVGARCAGYAADLTRTVPADGRFTPRQRELYQAVLGALKATIAAVRPGVMLGTRDHVTGLYQVARDYLNAHGKDGQGRPLGSRLLHPVAHRVGLDVHDLHAETSQWPLAPGDVLAIEPGVYIKEEGIGIRIEDMVLVTETGARLLSEALPREPDEIERMMRSGAAR